MNYIVQGLVESLSPASQATLIEYFSKDEIIDIFFTPAPLLLGNLTLAQHVVMGKIDLANEFIEALVKEKRGK